MRTHSVRYEVVDKDGAVLLETDSTEEAVAFAKERSDLEVLRVDVERTTVAYEVAA